MVALLAPPRRPKLAVFKFASCDGCQLQLVDLLERFSVLEELAEGIEIAYFLEASSDFVEGPYDLGLVEGSITTERDRIRIREVRESCAKLATIGACATSGGIQALRNWIDKEDALRTVYARPEYISTLRDSTAIADHVAVDFELRGCPIDKNQLREVVTSFVLGKRPSIPTYSVCIECKRRGNVCVTVARGEPCMGPVTQAGCDALCPTFARGCYGCFGAMEQPNVRAQLDLMRRQGLDDCRVGQKFCSFAHTTEFDSLARELMDRCAIAPTARPDAET